MANPPSRLSAMSSTRARRPLPASSTASQACAARHRPAVTARSPRRPSTSCTRRSCTASSRPVQRLPIEELAEVMGMSPMPIREAIRRLDSLGLLENVPHRGARAAALTVDDLLEVYEVRLELEPLAVERAALRTRTRTPPRRRGAARRSPALLPLAATCARRGRRTARSTSRSTRGRLALAAAPDHAALAVVGALPLRVAPEPAGAGAAARGARGDPARRAVSATPSGRRCSCTTTSCARPTPCPWRWAARAVRPGQLAALIR